MDLFSKFRKDYFNYLISIILPALISAISIPVFKNLLGAKGYGHFAIWLNAILIATATLSGWISQSIIRFFPASSNKYLFSKKAIDLSVKTQSVFFVPTFLIALYIGNDIVLALLCSLVLFTISVQFTVLPIIQSNFLSRKIISSETIRVITYVSLAILFLKFAGVSYLYSLLIAVFISYLLSLFYLIRQFFVFFKDGDFHENGQIEPGYLIRRFLNYGAPLSLWFVFTFLLSYVDKLFMFKYAGAEAQGNYQAIFDFLSKSITLIISPAVTSIFPILTSVYVKGDNSEIRKLLKKIIYYEMAGFFIASILYWWFGAALLLSILHTPNTFTFKLMGFIVIAGTFIWQLAILAQKRFELKLKSSYLLIMVIVAFLCQVAFYLLFKNDNSILIYPFGFLLSASIYLLLLSIPEIVIFSKRFTSVINK